MKQKKRHTERVSERGRERERGGKGEGERERETLNGKCRNGV